MNFYLLFYTAFFSLCFTGMSYGSSVDLLKELKPSPVILSGTLNPAFVSVNGHEYGHLESEAAALLVNGSPVEVVDQQGIKTFYSEYQENRLELTWVDREGHQNPIGIVELPGADSLRLEHERMIVQSNALTTGIQLDRKILELKEHSAIVPLPDFEDWLSLPHSMEFIGSRGEGRIYSLEVPKIREQVLSEWRVGLTTGSSDLTSVKSLYGIVGGRQFPSRMGIDCNLGYGTGSFSAFGSAVSFTDIVFRVFASYRPFFASDYWFDLKRFKIGPVAQLTILKDHSNVVDTSGNVSIDNGQQTAARFGLAFELEPFQWHGFGLSYQSVFFLLGSSKIILQTRTNNLETTLGALELNYHF